MYSVPELNLATVDTMEGWWYGTQQGTTLEAHGLVRVIAELYFGEQTAETVQAARAWIGERLFADTLSMFHELAERVHPRMLVEKSPATVYKPEYLHRLGAMFPDGHFLHLVRHPRSFCNSILNMPMGRAFVARSGFWDFNTAPPTLDPQLMWYSGHVNIVNFLGGGPPDQVMRLRGEDIMQDLDTCLPAVCEWLGIATNSAAIEAMKHPERSPYACIGPTGAQFGNDPAFLRNPVLRTSTSRPQSLEGPLSWRGDGGVFYPAVRELAVRFGYH